MPLDPEIAAYLEQQKSLPPRSGLTLEQTRARLAEAGRQFGGEPVALNQIEDFTLPSGIRARDYRAGTDHLVLYFHGGRFISGGLESHDLLCRRLAAAAGCRLVAVDYRLAPEHQFPAAIEDALAAAGWALRQADRVAVAGDSAGANLAALVAAERRSGICSQVLIYPMIDATRSLPSHVELGQGYGPSSLDMKRGWDEYLGGEQPPEIAKNPRVSPLFAGDLTGSPPAFVLTADYDSLRDEGEHYADALGRAGNHVQLKRYSGTVHGFITLSGISRLAREAVDDAGAFLRRSFQN